MVVSAAVSVTAASVATFRRMPPRWRARGAGAGAGSLAGRLHVDARVGERLAEVDGGDHAVTSSRAVSAAGSSMMQCEQNGGWLAHGTRPTRTSAAVFTSQSP